MFKRFLAVAVAFMLLLSILPTNAFAQTVPEDESLQAESSTVAAAEEEALTTVSIIPSFSWDSDFDSSAIGDITVKFIADNNPGHSKSIVLTRDTEWKAEIALHPDCYEVRFSGYEVDGYICQYIGADSYYVSDDGPQVYEEYFYYEKNESIVHISLNFDENSLLSSEEVGDITVILEDGEEYTATLTHDNGRSAQLTVPYGWYDVRFTGDEVDGYSSGLVGTSWLRVDPNEEVYYEETACYIEDKATLELSLEFLEESLLSSSDVGDITVTIEEGYEGLLSYTVVLSEENNRCAVLEIPSGYYEISFSGHEVDGYLCNLDCSDYEVLEIGDTASVEGTISYVKSSVPVTVALDFAEESLFSPEDVGEIVVIIEQSEDDYDDYYEDEEEYEDFSGYSLRSGNNNGPYRLTLSEENDFQVELDLAPGHYYVYFSEYQYKGYICGLEEGEEFTIRGTEEEYTLSRTVCYTDSIATVKVQLNFEEDSQLSSSEVGDIRAVIHRIRDDRFYTLTLSEENSRCAEIVVPTGYYNITFLDYEVDGYLCKFIDEADLPPVDSGDDDYDDGYEDDDYYEDEDDMDDEYEKDYTYDPHDLFYNPDLYVGDVYNVNCYLNYEKDISTLDFTIDFAEDSTFSPSDIGEIGVVVEEITYEEYYDYNLDQDNYEDDYEDDFEDDMEEYSTFGLRRINRYNVTLNTENDYHALLDLPSGYYKFYFVDYEKDGYVSGLEGTTYLELSVGEERNITRTARYLNAIAEIDMSVYFPLDNPFQSEDFGDIKMIIGNRYDDSFRQTFVLSADSDRKVHLTMPAGEYYVLLQGCDVPGYSMDYYVPTRLTYDNNTFSVSAGQRGEISVIVEHWGGGYGTSILDGTIDLTLNFDEDSVLSGKDLGDITATYTTEYSDKQYTAVLNEDNGWHAEVKVHSDDEYRLTLSCNISNEYHIIYSGADYVLNIWEDEIAYQNVVAKVVPANNSVTVRMQLAEGSNADAQDLYDSMRLSFLCADSFTEFVYNGGSEFTYTFSNLPTTDDCQLIFEPQWDGLSIESITCSVPLISETEDSIFFSLDGETNCEIVISLLAVKPEGKVTVITQFAEESALQAEDLADGIVVQLDNNNWRHLVEFGWVGDENDWTHCFTELFAGEYMLRLDGVDTVLMYASRGYMCYPTWTDERGKEIHSIHLEDGEQMIIYLTLDFVPIMREVVVDLGFAPGSALDETNIGTILLTVEDGHEFRTFEFNNEKGWTQTIEMYTLGGTFKLRSIDREGYSCTLKEKDETSYDWMPGVTEYVSFELNYTAHPGKLIVNAPGESVVYLLDDAGNVLAAAWVKDEFCTFTIEEAGNYTVTTEVDWEWAATADFYFDPTEGKTITLTERYVQGPSSEVTIYIDFGKDSLLNEEDFPEGMTVVLTNMETGSVHTFKLSQKNGWRSTITLPRDIYSIEIFGANVDGYTLRTDYALNHVYYGYGGESIGRWGSQPVEDEVEDGNDLQLMAGNKTYYLSADYQGDNYTTIQIRHTYKKEPATALVITNNHTFSEFGGAPLERVPETGYEASIYTYRLQYEDEDITFTLTPGESRTFTDIPIGTPYTITEMPPEEFAWNIPVITYSGVLTPSDTEDGKDGDSEITSDSVHIDNDYYYIFDEDCVVSLQKVDADTGKSLEGAKFGIYSDSACTKLLGTITSGSDGLCSYNFTEAGTYYIKEIAPPSELYQLSDDVVTVEVTQSWNTETRTADDGSELTVIVESLDASLSGLETNDEGLYVWTNEQITDSPSTGDDSHILLWVGCAAFALVCAMALLVIKKKSET